MANSNQIRVGIIGATAYTSREALRWLLRHPQVEIVALCSRRDPQPRIDEVFPEFAGRLNLTCEPIEPAALKGRVDVVFMCLPNGVPMQYVPALLDAGIKVVDFSADYRLKEPADYAQWYGKEHTDLANLEDAVYGLPELFRDDIARAKLVANPGCYPTAAALGTVPLVRAGLVDAHDIVIDAASGISGAGREPRPEHHFPERHENYEAYKVGEHRHQVEIERTVDPFIRQGKSTVLFVPHLIPMERGIHATIHLRPLKHISPEHVMQVFSEAYEGEPFVRLRTYPPRTAEVSRSNFCDISARVARGRIVVLSVIDNMVKGAAGQAIQNMNIMFGLEETAGLV